MIDSLAVLFPRFYKPRPRETKQIQQVKMNWLDVEVPRREPMPVVDALGGWRNREVFYYIRDFDWTARAYAQKE